MSQFVSGNGLVIPVWTERGGMGVYIPQELYTVATRREGLSRWLPSVVHRFPWYWIRWMPKELKKYREWERIVKEKHHIPHD